MLLFGGYHQVFQPLGSLVPDSVWSTGYRKQKTTFIKGDVVLTPLVEGLAIDPKKQTDFHDGHRQSKLEHPLFELDDQVGPISVEHRFPPYWTLVLKSWSILT